MTNALKQVLCGERPAHLPAAPAYPSLFLADFERNYYIEQYRLRLRGRERYPIEHDEDTEMRARAIYQSYGIFKSRPDWIEAHCGASRAWAGRTHIVDQEGVLHYEDITTGLRVPMRSIPIPRGDARLAPGSPASGDLWDISDHLQDRDDVDELLKLCRADVTSSDPRRVKRYLANFEKVVAHLEEVAEKDQLRAFQSPVRGDVIMAETGLQPGPLVGKLKKMIEEAILDGVIPNEYEPALSYLRKIKKEVLVEKIRNNEVKQ